MSSSLSHLIFFDVLVYFHVLVSRNVFLDFTCPHHLVVVVDKLLSSFQFISDVLVSNVR